MTNIKMVTATAAALALLATSGVFASSMSATPASPKPMMSSTMSHGKMVAYCAKCKMYYPAADAKKMHMMDSMGHKLMMMPMSKVPKDAKMGMAGSSKM